MNRLAIILCGAVFLPAVRLCLAEDAAEKFPERIVVRREGAAKSCAEIERFIRASNSAAGVFARGGDSREGAQEELNCAAAHAVPANADIALGKTAWNPALKRWEFALRCVHSAECVPFLVWARGTEPRTGAGTGTRAEHPKGNAARSNAKLARTPNTARQDASRTPVVKRGETAMLTWEQGGIRVVLPVICLEAGAAGQFVLVRLQNAPRTMRAEVMSAGEVRVSL